MGCCRLTCGRCWTPVPRNRTLVKTKSRADRAYDRRSRDSQYFDDHPLGTPPAKLRIEDPLPGAKVEPAVGHWQRCFMVQQQGLQMGVGIILAGPMMLVVRPLRR